MRLIRSILTAGLIFLVLGVVVPKASAVPVRNRAVTITQPTGQKFTVQTHGDEVFNWTTSMNGDLLVKEKNGFWYYGRISGSRILSTGSRFQIDPRPFAATKESTIKNGLKNGTITLPAGRSPVPLSPFRPNSIVSGNHKILVLLVQFTDESIINSETAWYNTFFGNTGSTVNNYFREVSGATFSFSPAGESFGIANNGVVKVTLNYPHPNTGGMPGDKNQMITADALEAANGYVDFSSFDTNFDGSISFDELHIVTIIAGYEWAYAGNASSQPNVHGHRWELSELVMLDGVILGDDWYNGGYTQQGELHEDHMATIGVLVHELAHDLGLPDLYDYDGDSEGVGIHSLMAGGAWGYVEGGLWGATPSHLDAWSKADLGFYTPVLAMGGSYIINAASTGDYNIIKIATSDPNQYFLVENRQYEGFDASLAAVNASGGIALWHIDEGIIEGPERYGVNDDENHKGVDLEEANQGELGFSQLDQGQLTEYDHYFYLGNNTSFGPATDPASSLYDGSSTGISVTVDVPSSDRMTVEVGIEDNIVPVMTSLVVPRYSKTSIFRVTWAAVDPMPGTGIDCYDVQYSLDGQTWQDWKLSFTGTSADFTGLHGKTYHFRARAYDHAGQSSAWTTYDARTSVDTSLPVISSFITPLYSTNITAGTGFNVSWKASDSGTGIASYDLQYRVGGSSTWKNWKTGYTATSANFLGTSGHTYYFRIKPQDRAGNGVWTTASYKTLVPLDNDSYLSRSGFGYTAKNAGFYRGAVRYSTKAGNVMTYRFTGNKAALIATRGPGRSKAKIYVDGVYKGTIDTYATGVKYRQAVYQASWTKVGTHTLKIVNSGTSGRPRLEVDGLAVGR